MIVLQTRKEFCLTSKVPLQACLSDVPQLRRRISRSCGDAVARHIIGVFEKEACGWLQPASLPRLMSQRERCTSDHRIKAQIITAGDPTLFPELGIPYSTAVSWIRRGVGAVVTLEDDSPSEPPLRDRVASLEYRISVLTAVLRLVLALLRVSGFKLQLLRIVSADAKRQLLSAVERARKVMPLEAALRVLGLSSARYHEWIGRQRSCALDDHPSRPRSRPQRLTLGEVEAIGELVQSKDYRHMSVRTLALRAQRIGKVFAHPGTWTKLIRERGWLRPRLRLHPAKPRIGFRTAAPNEAWHVDVTIIKLLDGTRAYLHAVIDNYSRRILAWTVAEKLSPMNTCYVPNQASAYLSELETKVFMDSGVENLNKSVDKLLEVGTLERVIAHVDVSFSDSMIEAWWRNLKHSWLFINTLDSRAAVQRLVAFYVKECNEVMPHGALDWRTPDEVYFGRAEDVTIQLETARRKAREARLSANRAMTCETCRGRPATAFSDAA